jgi:formate dehydrogenase maturation protein FdhE
MSSEQQQLLALLAEIRDGQREIIELLSHQQRLVAEQIQNSRATVTESVNLQRIALQRQRTIIWIAVPGILACIAAIAYLVIRYF